MSMATNSDPKTVKVRNGSAPSERTRERLTEESLSHIPDIEPPLAVGLVPVLENRQVGTGGWFPRSAITGKKVVTSFHHMGVRKMHSSR